jgi:hypothetical protein
MAIYTIHCVDHGDNVWHVENIECAADTGTNRTILGDVARRLMLPNTRRGRGAGIAYN